MAPKKQSSEASAPPPPSVASGEAVQHMIDQAATFNMYSAAADGNHDISYNGVSIGIRLEQPVHRFVINTLAPTDRSPLLSTNAIAEKVGMLRANWYFIPNDFSALPDRTPPATTLDQSNPTRFALMDTMCVFDNGRDGFRLFGTGLSLPSVKHAGDAMPVVAIATPLEGFGKFRGIDIGICTFVGMVSTKQGFQGSFVVRVMDREDRFNRLGTLNTASASLPLEPGITYAVFRGQATPDQGIKPYIDEKGRQVGVIVPQHLRTCRVDFNDEESGGLRTNEDIGPVIGEIVAKINFDPSSASGTVLDPIPDTAFCTWDFTQNDRPVGSFQTQWDEGRTINTELPGIQAIRFGNVGRIFGGTGVFANISGTMTDNSVVSFGPHVGASTYIMRINDPDGRYRQALDNKGGKDGKDAKDAKK